MKVMKIGNNPMYSQKQSAADKTKPAFKATLVIIDDGFKKGIGNQTSISKFLNTLGDVIKGEPVGKVIELKNIPFNKVKKLMGSILPEKNPVKKINS
jgi:hypothetical protein